MINITNTLKPEQLNHQMAFCIWGRAYWIQNGKLNTLVEEYWTCVRNSWIFQMPQNTEKQMLLLPKTAARFGQHLLKAKSNTENFELFDLYPFYFSYLLPGYLMANFCLLLRKQVSFSRSDETAFGQSIFGTKVTGRQTARYCLYTKLRVQLV